MCLAASTSLLQLGVAVIYLPTSMIVGQLVALLPMALSDRRKFFSWATCSDATPWWYGDRLGDEVPSSEVFKLEWPSHYFVGRAADKGRAFWIHFDHKAIGIITYHEVHPVDRSTQMDILIASATHMGHGLGTDAIKTLTRFLFQSLAITRIRIEVVAENLRAIRSYQKAGFQHIYTYVLHSIEWRVMECLCPQE